MTFVRAALMAVFLGAVLGRLGPYGTFTELEPAERYGYWIGLTLLMGLQIAVALELFRTKVRHWMWEPRAIISGLVASVPTAFEVAWAENLLRVERDLNLLDVWGIYGDVVILALPMAFFLEWVELGARSARLKASAAKARPPRVEGLLASIPPHRRGAILAVAAEDHYLRIHTDLGDSLVSGRFGDALSELAGLRGLQVHRSWWVASDAVERSEKDGERLSLVLQNGLRVPVSRSYLVGVREAGLIAASPSPVSS